MRIGCVLAAVLHSGLLHALSGACRLLGWQKASVMMGVLGLLFSIC